MGGVRGELELATAGLFDGAGGLDADHQGSQEHAEEENQAGHDLQSGQVGLDVVGLRKTLADHEPGAVHLPGLQSEVRSTEVSFIRLVRGGPGRGATSRELRG